MSELKENDLSEVPTEKQASQTDLAVLSDPVQTDLEANQSDEADNFNFANQKFANIRSDVHIVSLDRRSTVATEADTEMKYLLELLASLRSRHILTGKLEGVESSEAGVGIRNQQPLCIGTSALFIPNGVFERNNNPTLWVWTCQKVIRLCAGNAESLLYCFFRKSFTFQGTSPNGH